MDLNERVFSGEGEKRARDITIRPPFSFCPCVPDKAFWAAGHVQLLAHVICVLWEFDEEYGYEGIPYLALAVLHKLRNTFFFETRISKYDNDNLA